MGRSAYAYTFVAVEFTMPELRAWLQENYKSYNDADYGNNSKDEYELANQWAATYDASKYKVNAFAIVNYEDKTVDDIYCGVLLNEAYVNAYWEGDGDAETTNFSIALKHVENLKKKFPGKTPKIVTLPSIL